MLVFQADRQIRKDEGGKTNAGRIILEHANNHVFAFQLDLENTKKLAEIVPPREIWHAALDGVPGALAEEVEIKQQRLAKNEVELDAALPNVTRDFLTAEEWYDRRLTLAQRKFVDHPLTNSVRLVGPAGTGKTLAMAIKCIKELKKSLADGQPKRALFLTNAYDTAQTVEELIQELEPGLGIELLASDKPALMVNTLYSLADMQMRYDLNGLTPVSIDGYEGKSFQADVLNDVIREYKSGNWIAYKSGCSTPFIKYIEAPEDSMERRFFLWEVLNEFACVLDAEGVKSGSDRRATYLSEKRKAWMMVLNSKEERDVMLNLYDAFRLKLREMKAIGSDQMITDFLNHLDSFRWEATREEDGYDLIFVDELHLFNRQERMVFRNLMRSSSAAPSVFMAYDAKQSPRDTFLKLPSIETKQLDLWRDAKLGNVEKIELVDVFRYTPQIAEALSRIDASFPGQNLDDDWPQYTGISKTDDGPVPIICNMPSTNAVYRDVFVRARNKQRELGKSGRVAILCASNELFGKYLQYSAFRENFVTISSRDDAMATIKGTRKFIFSMPEYVAGLQFDTVYLIEANKDEVPEGAYAAAAQRKFVSQIYLGASRAERILEIYSTEEHGGISPVLSQAVLSGALRQVEIQDL
ncbi:ATP-binding protein [Pseudomonas putida]|uniref:UvrD-helicase domain-containing protein n=1 Tax=Pseudomonas putida TaxID=303 RepID=UPI00236412DE|nr:UvrD-helicase domain-containing protein [Pseudomonas putida]MDD1965893.1 ATP-binding protein [Pseudomonas putida]